MTLVDSIHSILKKKAGKPEKTSGEANEDQTGSPLGTHEDPQRLQQILEGMGTGTARLVIDKEASEKITEAYALKGLSNRGRYYVAKVVRPDGSVIDELLVDKQNGNVQFLGRRS